jgi:Domain of unknown function (DUF4340)
MKQWITILGGLLAFQLVLVIAMNFSSDDYGAYQSDEKLLPFDIETTSRLRFDDGIQHVILEKQNDEWVLPEIRGYPVNANALGKLLKSLSTLSKGWPVATTPGAAERFKVAENDYERKVSFMKGSQVQATLYIGTSPGFRKAHVRLSGSNDIFVVTLESWETSAQADHWLKKDILRINPMDIDRLVMNDVVLIRSGQTMQPVDLAEHETPDTETINSLINRLAGLQIQSVPETVDKEDGQQSELVLEIDLTLTHGESLKYRFFKFEEAGSHYSLERSDLPYSFIVAAFSVDALRETERSVLVRTDTGDSESIPELKKESDYVE